MAKFCHVCGHKGIVHIDYICTVDGCKCLAFVGPEESRYQVRTLSENNLLYKVDFRALIIDRDDQVVVGYFFDIDRAKIVAEALENA